MPERTPAGVLDVAYEESGDPGGWPVVLLHGFPYDVRAYDAVVPTLAAAGARVVVPWLRGFGPTRFLSGETPRSPAISSTGSPGTSRISAKVSRVTPKKVGINSPRRLAMNDSIRRFYSVAGSGYRTAWPGIVVRVA